jgi:choline dehydrogenase-like flavoprotein
MLATYSYDIEVVGSGRRDGVAAQELESPDAGIERGRARTRGGSRAYQVPGALDVHGLEKPAIRRVEANADGGVVDPYSVGGIGSAGRERRKRRKQA